MSEELLVRAYDVGFGDCIYVQIPDGEGCFTMLIDCGTLDPGDRLEPVVGDVCKSLLDANQGHLDLLVVTHPHADHIKGFNPQWFKGVKIGRIWLPVFMNPSHPQANNTQAFAAMAGKRAAELKGRGLVFAPGVESLLERSAWSIGNTGALNALRKGLAKASRIQLDYPLYVARDVAQDLPGRLSEAQRKTYKLSFEQGTTCFRGFANEHTCLRVLAPEWDVDKWYLGQGSFDANSFVDQALLETETLKVSAQALDQAGPAALEAATAPARKAVHPSNISAADFKLLCSRFIYSGLAFSLEDEKLKNNTSVVLLLEWRGRRLLFTGDAMWQGAEVEEGRRNSTWDVMLGIPAVKQVLLQEKLDLLKVGHHGSHNGTPFEQGGKERVLDQILSADRTNVVVSTVTGQFDKENEVPYRRLMGALGSLAHNKRLYSNTPEPREQEPGEPDLRVVDQPQRTDLEQPVLGKNVRYVEVRLDPAAT